MADEVLKDIDPLDTIECGCLLFEFNDGYNAGIEFCPLHRAAPALLAACELYMNNPQSPNAYDAIKAAIAAVRPEAADG